jgi:DNA-binding MarR family transcriptional regulator
MHHGPVATGEQTAGGPDVTSEMGRPAHLVEYETMLLGRHLHLAAPPTRQGGRTMERSAYILLSRIRVEGPMSIGQLSDAFGLDPSTLNRQTSSVLRAGLVERIPDPDGGMARKFRITAEGERRLEQERGAIVGRMEEVMADWDPEDVATFAGYLQRFNTGIERVSGRPWPRPALSEPGPATR